MSRYCNGICIMGSDLIEGARGVAYPHPECELHSGYVEPERCPNGDEHDYQCLDVEGHEGQCRFPDWDPVDFPMPNPDAPYVWGDPPTEVPF